MTAFQTLANLELPCDICGGVMMPMLGGGWDNDRLLCGEIDCGGEIEFPTSTAIEDYFTQT